MAQYKTTTTDTTTTNTTTSVNEGTKLSVTSVATTSTVGNFVSDVTVQPYIANRIVSFIAYNMRPNQGLHIFFDGVMVDQFCASGVRDGSNNYILPSGDPSSYTVVQRATDWGAKPFGGTHVFKSDKNGIVTGQFNIPDSTFKIGDRVLEITDVDNIVKGNDAMSTVASATLTATPNITVTKQTLTLTTINPQMNFTPVTNTIVTSVSNTVTTTNTEVVAKDVYNTVFSYTEPLAQTLTINTPNKEAGVFATSLDLYFKQRSQVNNGISIYICEINNGYPDGKKIIPFSYVHIPNSSVNISEDASVATTFTFESPVFLNNGLQYAFVVKPDCGDQDFWVYTANLGDVDITTNIQVVSQPAIGTAFYGATETEWTALQTEYVKFDLHIAKFTKTGGNVILNNDNSDYFYIENVILPNNQLNILSGDYVFQSTGNEVANVNLSIFGVVDYYDDVKNIVYVANSTGNFTGDANSILQFHRFPNTSTVPLANTYIAYANVTAFYNPKVNSVMPEFATLIPAGTTLSLKYSGMSNTNNLDSNTINVKMGYETSLYDYERVVLGRSSENSLIGGQKSMSINVDMFSDSPLLSPAIDTVKSDVLTIRNIIDPIITIYDEFFGHSPSQSRYISQIVTLAPEQDAEDLQVIVSGYRPPGSDIQIWVRFQNAEDSESMSSKTWTPLRNSGYNVFSDPTNPNDFREYVYTTYSGYPLVATTGTVTCNNSVTTIVGTNTNFTYDVTTGIYINMKANSTFSETSRQIISIANNNNLIIDKPFNGNYVNQPYYIVPPPTTAWLANQASIQLTGTVSTSTINNSITGYSTTFTANTTNVNNVTDEILIIGADTYFAINDKVFYLVPTGNTAVPGLVANNFYYVQSANSSGITLSETLGGTVVNLTAIGTAGETHILQKTHFTSEVHIGDVIAVANDQQVVTSIANNTYLSVGTVWTSSVTNANAFIQSTGGLTYINGAGSRFTSFKKFQIKVVLESNDSSKVPIIDNLRGIALQL